MYIVGDTTVSDVPDLGSITPTAESITYNSLTVLWQTLALSNLQASYYWYEVQIKSSSGNFEAATKVWASESGAGTAKLRALKPDTSYTLRVMPYRDINVTTYGNQRLEAGQASRELTVRTSSKSYTYHI